MATPLLRCLRSVNKTNIWKLINFGGDVRWESSVLNGKTLRIGCASGFWGDTATAVPQLVHLGKLDFLVFDYLSEITMSLLVAAKKKFPEYGYTPDFVLAAMAPNLSAIKQQGIRVISNAGGISPHLCAKALKEEASKQGIEINVAVITGDDLMAEKERIEKENYKEMTSDLPFPKTVNSMNAYLGAGPISAALDKGAEVVITGRCVDSAIVLGPLIHNFKWKLDDWDKLASGSLAGHLVECGAQSTGGIFTDWHQVSDWDNMGFPIVECAGDGKFIITKPESTGGLVSTATVSEQLLYEIGDPQNYLLPDVTCDFTQVKLTQIADDNVLVEGAKGKPPTKEYKVSATYSDGYRAIAVCPIKGPRAVDKAEKSAEAVLKRCNKIFDYMQLGNFRRVYMEILGSEQSYGRKAISKEKAPREVVMWVGVHHDNKLALQLFARELASSATGGAPGMTNLVGGRPKPAPVLKLYSFLYPKEKVKIEISMNDKTENYDVELFKNIDIEENKSTVQIEKKNNVKTGTNTYRLEDLAYTRSGDKGDTANIGVIARHPSFVPYLEHYLSEAAVADYFVHLFENSESAHHNVKRYYLPGINAFNFVLNRALGGGGVASLRSDPQGKALGQILLDFEFQNMPSIEEINNK
ncbi:uncharacterized protein [Centruroides vittatus]|uniref:uncharacterized protein isoform X1 n=2 Tax=Centruroides vittatus TaxID=120091 RepID=UPI003510C7C9